MEQVKVLLEDHEIPKQWYNVVADLPAPMKPPLHPGTGQPVTPDDLAAIFPMNIIEQEASAERWIDIPDEVLQKYLLWRPSPLYRAYNFEKLLNCPVKIYYKNEGVSPAGSHKPMPPFLWLIIIKWPALNELLPKPAPDNGAAPCPWPPRCSVWPAAFTWSRSVMSKSLTGA